MSDQKKLFISHAEKDISIVEKFVDLLFDMGIPEECVFCSSISELGVPNKVDIYDYLRNLLDSDEVVPIFMLSSNYYASPACLNEMGAVWIKQKDYFLFLLPGFTFSQIKGAINPSKRGIALGYQEERELRNLKSDLNQFHQDLIQMFSLKDRRYWERKRDEFIAVLKYSGTACEQFNLKNHRGLCIGADSHRGCAVTFDEFTKILHSDIDFHLTKAEICSTVIHTGEQNLSYQYQAGKALCFDLKASDTIHCVEVECRLKNIDASCTISTSALWTHYEIPLSEFNDGISEWESLKEIKFLVRREYSTGGHLEIKNLSIG